MKDEGRREAIGSVFPNDALPLSLPTYCSRPYYYCSSSTVSSYLVPPVLITSSFHYLLPFNIR